MKLSNETYNVAKWVAMVVLPAFVLFFKTVGLEVGFEHTEVVANILIALNAFLGTVLGVSTAEYNKEK